MLIIQRPTIEALGDEVNNRQSFGIGPLDPGFGHTLGNSLRRTLLSSIPGAAATRVKFDAVLHEFGVIEGVKEDVQDICLNLKDLLLQVHSDEPVTLRLDKKGEGPVTAADLSTTADVEILNRDLHLAYLTSAQERADLRADRRARQGLRRRRGQQGIVDDRGHPARRDLLPGASRQLRDRARARRAVQGLRPPRASRSRPTAPSARARPWPRPARPSARWSS